MGAGTKVAGGAGAKARFAAALAFASELLLLWVLPGMFVAWPLVGSFVLLAAVCQGLLAASLFFGPGRWTIRFGLLLNATIVFAWAATRVGGFPALFGFARLPVEPVGLVATIIEIVLWVLLLKIGRGLKTEPKNRRAMRKHSIKETERNSRNDGFVVKG
jgi:hypothetical protein